MNMMKHIQTWLLITLLALSANGVVSAKLASGPQNLSGNLHQSQTVLNALLHQGLEQVSTTNASGSPLATKGGAQAFKNLSKADKALANNFMTQFGKGSKGATQLLDDIGKNGAPKLDSTTRNALQAYRETIRAVGGNKTKTAGSEVFQTRLKVLDKVLGE